MKVVAFNGSPRKNGNTYSALKTVCGELSALGIETEIIQIGGKALRGCIACAKCRENKDMKCAVSGDDINLYISKMVEADGIIIGSPVYFGNVTAEVKALIDRAGYVTRGNDMALRRKVGAAVVAVRRAGSNFTYAAINFLFGISEMTVAHSSYWNMTTSRDIGDYEKDAEGIKTFENLGKNMAWLLEKMR